jgi:hypothetical protein
MSVQTTRQLIYKLVLDPAAAIVAQTENREDDLHSGSVLDQEHMDYVSFVESRVCLRFVSAALSYRSPRTHTIIFSLVPFTTLTPDLV